MPYPQEHSARLENPDKYDDFRRENNKLGDGIHVIWGIKGDTTEMQAIRFDKDKYTAAEAKEWLQEHDIKPIEFEPAKEEKSMNILMRRYMELRAEPIPEDKVGTMRLVASTEEPASFGSIDEVLVHEPGAVDYAGLNSMLFNHDPNQVIGRVMSCNLDDKKMRCDFQIAPEVVGSNGLKIKEAIEKGYLKGVSIGYDYNRADCTISEENDRRMVRVNKWRLMEVSITPLPKDPNASVQRSLAELFEREITHVEEESTMSDEVKSERERADAAEAKLVALSTLSQLQEVARTHGVEASVDELRSYNLTDGLRFLLGKKSAAVKPQEPAQSAVVTVTEDATDKVNAAAEDALLALAGIKQEKNLGMRGGSALSIGRRWMAAQGRADLATAPQDQLASELLGVNSRRMFKRDAANVTSGQFTTYVMANTFDKVVQKGFDQLKTTYEVWTGSRQVPDFKQFTGGALDNGMLIETASNCPFPELVKGEGGYNGTLGLWGATLSLTLQALINDDLGEFMRMLARAGTIAKRTIDKQVYTKVAAATWTNHTTADDLSADALTTARGNLEAFAGPGGEKLGITAKYLIVPSCLRGTALGLTQIAPYTARESILVDSDLTVVSTPHLAAAGTPAQSVYYVAGDQAVVDTVLVATLTGWDTPRVEEYDPGSCAARNWKIMMPFVVVVPTGLYGMWQMTHG